MKPSRRCRMGFSLIEVLIAVTLIVILTSVLLSVGDGTRAETKRRLAEAELAMLGQALERYRTEHGDYPLLSPGTVPEVSMFHALTDPPGSFATEQLRTGPPPRGHPGGMPGQTVILDPWGQPYIYRYREQGADLWQRQGYILLSLGPSGQAHAESGQHESPHIPPSGLIPPTYRHAEHAHDNLFLSP